MSVLTCEQVARAVLGEPTKRAGAELLWPCPNHEDKHPSLSVNPKKNVFLCAPCNASGTAWQLAVFLARLDPGDKPAVTTWLKERGLFKGTKSSNAISKRGPCVAEYVYRTADEKLIARKLRFEPGADGRKKDFIWQRWENRTWVSGLGSVKTPLYRLPEIAAEPFVILTEGERDSDAGATIGLPTATSGGVGSFREDHAEMLRSKRLVIVADADDPGREHAQKVATVLFGKAASVKVCEIPDSKDLAEAVEKGTPKNCLVALFEDTLEWKPAEGHEILDSVFTFIRRFVSLTEAQGRVAALWIAHTHALDAVDCTPYLSVNSAEKQSGKTRFLEVAQLLVANPWYTGRASAAVLIRKVDMMRPTLLLDETDAAFGSGKEYAEALRGILNTGYRRGGASSCCIGQGAAITFKDFSTFCPKAIAGIGRLPDTVADRSIPIILKREPRGRVERFRRREVEPEAAAIKSRLAVWCASNLDSLRQARPATLDVLSDRQADCCEPLLAIANLVGVEWLDAARRALVGLCTEAQADDQSTGVQLLTDIRSIFGERDVDRLSSGELAESLAGIETSPWGEWSHGKPLTASKMARMLSRYGITPGTIRVESKTAKGYYLTDFEDAFTRYIPLPKCHNVTRPINIDGNGDCANVTREACDGTEKPGIVNADAGCDGVTVSEPGYKGGSLGLFSNSPQKTSTDGGGSEGRNVAGPSIYRPSEDRDGDAPDEVRL
ncbi:MAG: DUF3631 domain-containing protein [Candidatus Acidiferrales bacterium]